MTKEFTSKEEAYEYFYDQIKSTPKYLGLLLNVDTLMYEVRTSPPESDLNYVVIDIYGTV